MTFVWEWPQIVLAGMIVFGVIVTALLDGKSRTSNHSFAIKLCDAAITVFVLYMGGFWT